MNECKYSVCVCVCVKGQNIVYRSQRWYHCHCLSPQPGQQTETHLRSVYTSALFVDKLNLFSETETDSHLNQFLNSKFESVMYFYLLSSKERAKLMHNRPKYLDFESSFTNAQPYTSLSATQYSIAANRATMWLIFSDFTKFSPEPQKPLT